MKPVNVAVTFKPTDLPDGVTAGSLKVTIEKEDASPAVDSKGIPIPAIVADAGPYVFADVPSGSYIVTVQRLDSAGANLGLAVSSVATAVVQPTFDAPATVTVTVG